jgi:glycosyltransferase involved in cell wall biosynthesis
VVAFDAATLPGTRPRCTISRRVSERLEKSNGIASEALYHPPPMAPRHYCEGAQPFVFFPSRVEHAKRQELVVRAMAHVKQAGFAVFAGEGGQVGAMRDLAERLGVAGRVRFLGRVDADEMLALYARAAAVVFTPLDEDYGYVTLEAMLSGKPVITCADSGGPLEFVLDGETGLVAEPEPEAVGRAIDALLAQPARAARMGRAGRERYAAVVPGWNVVVDRLLAM